ncbi:hypothetical protein [Neobacillus drentensis]|uniref:hypothetical protein n=1 Tax=Neobacillus drentensis TaxID=220684 RepID=UPI002FFFC19C
MRPKQKEKTAKGFVERFYTTEAKGKKDKRSRTVYLQDRGQSNGTKQSLTKVLLV